MRQLRVVSAKDVGVSDRRAASSSRSSTRAPPRGQHTLLHPPPVGRRPPLSHDAVVAPAAGAAPDSETRAGVVAWRVFDVSVPLSEDAGKDDATVTKAVMAALRRRLHRPALSAAHVSLVRKSFDARRRRQASSGGAAFSYVLDVDAAAFERPPATVPGLIEPAPPPPSELPPPPPPPPEAQHPPPPHRDLSGDPRQRDMFVRSESANRVIVVGGGPSGLFAALRLAEAGLPVTLLERGQPVERRGADIGALFARRILSPESNLCFGEGGAGTWSDGKLTTRIGRNAAPVRRVLSLFVAFGAPPSILVDGKPHLGTDRLVTLLRALRSRLVDLGVTIRWGSTVDALLTSQSTGAVTGVRLSTGEALAASTVVLAPGHSSRPLYTQLVIDAGVLVTPQPCAVGFRAEHPQSLIDAAQYGPDIAARVLRGKGAVPVADYRLVSAAEWRESGHCDVFDTRDESAPQQRRDDEGGGGNTARGGARVASTAQPHLASSSPPPPPQPLPPPVPLRRAAYSFCMCPGGQVVPTSVDPSELCVNGMSFSKRASPFANSGLVVPVGPTDYAPFAADGAHLALAGLAFQAAMERAAAVAGGGALVAPVQTIADFLDRAVPKRGAEPPASSYRLGVARAALHELYPPAITDALTAALVRFDAKLPGYASHSGVPHGVETRTSAPLRIERGGDFQSVSTPGLYPIGEGAGYAGGIVSAAVDGLNAADAVVLLLRGGHWADGEEGASGGGAEGQLALAY